MFSGSSEGFLRKLKKQSGQSGANLMTVYCPECLLKSELVSKREEKIKMLISAHAFEITVAISLMQRKIFLSCRLCGLCLIGAIGTGSKCWIN